MTVQHTDPATAEDRPRNQHCMNCGDTRGGPIGHETSECTYDSAANATRRQLNHVAASMQTNRAGWTDQQYLDDARRLLGDVDGSVLDLVNGHASAMLHEIDRLSSELEAAQARLDKVARLRYDEVDGRRFPHEHSIDGPECAGCWVDAIDEALGLGEESTAPDAAMDEFEAADEIDRRWE